MFQTNSNYWKRVVSILLLFCALVLPACGENQPSPETEDGILIYAALNPVSKEVESSIKRFNNTHTDVQIEVRDYSDEGGLERLQTELVLGKVPDIMEMHYFGKSSSRTDKNNSDITNGSTQSWRYTGNSTLDAPADEYWMPYRQMAQKGYLEDLWPYIESDPDLGRDGVVQAPMKAAEINGGLYILFQEIRINTVMGPESIVGDRYNWTLEELLDIFASMPEDSTILRYDATKQEVFFDLLRFSMDKYVDVDAGTCSFDNQDFRELLEFLDCFPDDADTVNPKETAEKVMEQVRTRRQMLEVTQISWPEDLIRRDGFWQERTAFPGYPTADGSSGNSFYAMGDILAMSSTCRDKDAAWDYIRELIRPRRSRSRALVPFVSTPVNQHDYEIFLQGNLDLMENYKEHMPENPLMAVVPWEPFGAYGPEIYPIALLTEEDMERYDQLFNHTTLLYWPDNNLSDTIWDSIIPYFGGDRSLEETVALVQNRVQLYVDEQR